MLVVLDGLGDLATKAQNELTPLEAAKTPNLDKLVADSEREVLATLGKREQRELDELTLSRRFGPG